MIIIGRNCIRNDSVRENKCTEWRKILNSDMQRFGNSSHTSPRSEMERNEYGSPHLALVCRCRAQADLSVWSHQTGDKDVNLDMSHSLKGITRGLRA